MAFWEHAIVPEIAENIQKHAQTCIRITYFLKTKRLFQSSYSINRTQCMANHPFFHCQPKDLKYSLQKEKKCVGQQASAWLQLFLFILKNCTKLVRIHIKGNAKVADFAEVTWGNKHLQSIPLGCNWHWLFEKQRTNLSNSTSLISTVQFDSFLHLAEKNPLRVNPKPRTLENFLMLLKTQ